MAFNYDPLDSESYEIRVLTIFPGAPESDMKCTMEITSLINPISYAALSYCWGDPAITTDILVNGTKTAVTYNLADALKHLRKLGVRKIWADALCINQEDRQEKSLQIRNMRSIYSRAEVCYAWLGREKVDDDESSTIIGFLESLLDSGGGTRLAQVPHTCIAIASIPTERPQQQNGQPRHESCRSCILEHHFQGLQRILQRQYWKRRWIIQETSASYRQVILANEKSISLKKMEQAINLCQQSGYWSPDINMAYSWFKMVTKFRRRYQKNVKLSLIHAIKLSQDFESTDQRDAVFSLLGLCHDGLDLVPMPNYVQSIETILIDLTRALIRKQGYLDFILIQGRDQKNRTSSKVLPSWVPNWLDRDLPSKAFDLAETSAGSTESRFCLGDSISRDMSLGHGKTLPVQGVAVGKILAMTTSTDSMVTAHHRGTQSSNSLLPDPPFRYYYGNLQVLTALLACFTLDQEGQHHWFQERRPLKDRADAIYSRFQWQLFCTRSMGLVSSRLNPDIDKSTESVSESRKNFQNWLETNSTFEIQGQTLDSWTKERIPLWAPLHTFHPSMILVFASALVIILFVTITLLLPVLKPTVAWTPIILLGIALVELGVILGMLCTAYTIIYKSAIAASKRLWRDWKPLTEPGKRLIVADKGFLGMADDRAQEGDMLFFLVGCSEPAILRQVAKGKSLRRGRRSYEVVGRCYVHLSTEDEEGYLGPRTKTDPNYDWRKWEWMCEAAIEEIVLV